MRTRRIRGAACAIAVLPFVVAACGDDEDSTPVTEPQPTAEPEPTDEPTAAPTVDEESCPSLDPVNFQMQWAVQAQFAGYYAADALGYFEDACLDVTLIEAGVETIPQAQLASGAADFAIAWVPKALATREAGADIVNIAQIFQRSGTLQVSFVDAGITSPADFAGRTIGTWGFGNEYEVFAALGQAGLDPVEDVDLFAQDFNMNALLDGSIDAAEAMTYNEYAQVLEALNPDTGELYQPEDFNVISYEQVGVGMLQDAIWADGARLADDAAYRDIAVRLVNASIRGWVHCRDNVQECTDIVLAAGPTLGASHQLWQMNEVNKLIWPSPNGIGYIDQAAWDRTVEISINTPNLDGATVLTQPPTDGAFTNDIVEAAWASLGDLDLEGAGFAPIEVTLNEGGN